LNPFLVTNNNWRSTSDANKGLARKPEPVVANKGVSKYGLQAPPRLKDQATTATPPTNITVIPKFSLSVASVVSVLESLLLSGPGCKASIDQLFFELFGEKRILYLADPKHDLWRKADITDDEGNTNPNTATRIRI